MNTVAYLEQGQNGNSRWWSWLITFVITVAIWIIAQTILLGVVIGINSVINPELSQELMTLVQTNPSDSEEQTQLMMQMVAANPFTFALFLLSFPAALAGLYIGQKFIHKRTLTSLHTAAQRFNYARAFQAFFVMWAILAIATVIAKLFGAPINYVFDSKRFWGFFIVSLIFIPMQSATEEIVFRGYFNQALGHWISNKWIVFTLTSLVFMALHLSNPEALKGAREGVLPIVMSGYFFFGFAACLLVMIDDGLESAIGLHAANNTFAAIFVNYEGSVLPTPSIWQTVPNPTLDTIATIIVLGIAVTILYYLKPKAG